MSAMPRFDVVVAGGGLAGLSLVNALRPAIRCGLKVAVLEAFPGVHRHNRALALNLRTLALLAEWGVAPMPQAPIGHIEVSARGVAGRVRLDGKPLHQPRLGGVVWERALHQALLESLPDGVTWQAPARLTGWQLGAEFLDLALDDGQRWRTRLLVGADGPNSEVRALAGLPVAEHDYQQTAWLFPLCAPQAGERQDWAFERFDDQGPMALLPVPPSAPNLTGRTHRFEAVWCLPGLRHPRGWDDPERLVAAFADSFGSALGPLEADGPAVRYALLRRLARPRVAPRLLLCGQAAATLHPVAGQGFNLVARDVAAIAAQVGAAEDPGAWSGLVRLARSREDDEALIGRFTDGLDAIFAREQGEWLKGTALWMASKPWVSGPLVRLASGLLGNSRFAAVRRGGKA